MSGATRGVTLSLLLAASVASAQEGYTRLRAERGGACIAWQARHFVYTVDAAGSAQAPGESEFAAIDASFATWQAAADACSDFTFERSAPTPDAAVGYDPDASDNRNALLFRETRCRDVVPAGDPCIDDGSCSNRYRCWDRGDFTIALTLTSYTAPAGVILDADIELNASPRLDGSRFVFTTVDTPPCDPGELHSGCVATDVQNTVTHEIGHVLGLDHVGEAGSTMEATAPLGETTKRSLDPGTRRGLCEIYPPHRPAPSCDPAWTGQYDVVVAGRGTPGLGCSAVGPGASVPLAVLAIAVARARRRRARR